MSTSYLDILAHVLRQPRHRANGQSTLQIEFRCGGKHFAGENAPQIIDCSRGGCRLNWTERLLEGEPVQIRLSDTTNGLALELAAKVRWSFQTPEGSFAAGCQFDQELDYEHLGELFLAGFLSEEDCEAP